MNTNKVAKILFIIILGIAILVIPYHPSLAKTSEEIAEELIQKEDELEQLNQELVEAEKGLTEAATKMGASQGELERIVSELVLIEQQAKVNTLKGKQLSDEVRIKELQQIEKEVLQDKEIGAAYMSWKTPVYGNFSAPDFSWPWQP